jgi:hypothetical protein
MRGSRRKIPNKNLVRQCFAEGFNSGAKGLISVCSQIGLIMCFSAISLMECFDCKGYHSCKPVIIVKLLREQAVGGQNITDTRGDGHRFLVTLSLLMALLYTIYGGCASQGMYIFTQTEIKA